MASVCKSGNFACLPSVCLRIVFRHLPLLDLICCSQVCQNWRKEVYSYGSASIRSIQLKIDTYNCSYWNRFKTPYLHLLEMTTGSQDSPESAIIGEEKTITKVARLATSSLDSTSISPLNTISVARVSEHLMIENIG
jgi:hypothetical protein